MQALFDSGSDVNLIRLDSFNEISHGLEVEKCMTVFHGLGFTQVQALGRFNATVYVDNNSYANVLFYIVPNNAMMYPIILGQQFLQSVVMILENNNVLVMPSNEQWLCNLGCFVSNSDIIGGEVSLKVQQQARQLMEDYSPLKTKEAPVELRIILKDDIPVAQRPRRLAIKEQQEVNAQINNWLKDDIIRVSHSEYASPLVIVRKKDGSARVCVDYRLINAKMVKDEYPLPIVDDLIDKCKSGKIWSALDLKNGYFHLKVHEDSIKYTAFVTPTAQYEFLRAPFGLAVCPKTFTRFITIIFRDLIEKGIILIFIDDLLILAEDEKQAVDRLSQVLQRASEYGLEINWKKSQLLVRKVEYLGHVIEDGKISPSLEKTEAVMKYPEPKNLKELHSFIGMCSYFRKFINSFAQIARPLTELLKKDREFEFNSEQRRSFNILKECLVTKPVLRIYDSKLHTELHTDASCQAYSAILMQKNDDGKLHPVHYMSRKTTEAQSKYTSYELEALAIIEGVKKFRHYLFGIHFIIVTDCKAFQMTLNKKELAMSTRVARWIMLLQDYDFEIVHREGSKMKHTDALSRIPYVSTIFADLRENIRYAQENDVSLKAIIEILKKQPYEDYILDNGLLFKGLSKQLVIPKTMETEILRRVHSNGHFSAKKMLELINKDYYIEKVSMKIQNFISMCIPCLLANRKEGKQEGFLNPIDKEDIPLHTLHIDHIGPMTETRKQYNHILTIIDGFTKFVWIFPTKSTTSKEALDKIKIHQQNFGNPCRIITDRGTAFTSSDFEEYCKEEGVQHLLITTGVPRGNGQVERVHRTIVSVLTKLCIENPTLWYRHVHRLQKALNSTYQRSINTTPFELMIGTKMRCKEDLEIYDMLKQEHRDNFVESREELRVKAKQHIFKIQEENRKNYNRRRKRSKIYKVGDIAAIKRTQFGVGMKLKSKYRGPYKVTKVKGKDRYDVEKMDRSAEGPIRTSSSADYMKPWPTTYKAE